MGLHTNCEKTLSCLKEHTKCSVTKIADSKNINYNQVKKTIEHLEFLGKVKTNRVGNATYVVLAEVPQNG